MSRIKVTNTVEPSGDGICGYGTVVELEGKPLSSVRSIEIAPITVDSIMSAKIEILATDDFHFEADANLAVSIVPFPGCDLVETTDESGRKVYRCVPSEVRT